MLSWTPLLDERFGSLGYLFGWRFPLTLLDTNLSQVKYAFYLLAQCGIVTLLQHQCH